SQDTRAMVRAVHDRFDPARVLFFRAEGEDRQSLEGLAGYVKSQGMKDGKATAYVCRNYACRLPVTDVEGLKKLLAEE
ncbi:MAG TPA: thioredoxin domain-containing protein, partial [Planctomycetota bacterium]|nr:thioredoxin domain-containing protein [Planctomycetota bacterium]